MRPGNPEQGRRSAVTGKAGNRFDAYAKVTGKEKYTADYYGGDCLRAGVKRAGVPHALLKNIYIEEAKTIPGVVAVLTHRDIKGSNRQGIIRKDHPVLVDDKIRYTGDAVALVVAETEEALKDALDLITFQHEPLPGVFEPEEALKEGAPVIHEDNPDGNLLRRIFVETGKKGDALKDSEVIAEGSFELPYQEHAYLETEAGWAYATGDGKLVIVASTQTPFRDRIEIAHSLGMEAEDIRVIAPYLGGAFGGKDGVTVQSLLGLAALNAGGRPVKMWWDRYESFLAGVKRLPARMHYRLGAKGDGTLHELECRLYFNAGAYAGLCGEVMALAIEHAGGAYRIPNVSIHGWCVYTNNPIGGPFRGFGVPQATAAMEQMMDILAGRLDMDPLELRLKNALRHGDKNCMGVTLNYSTGLLDCLQELSRHPLWQERDEWKKAAQAGKKRGAGLAALSHAMGYPPAVPDIANAKIELTGEGAIRVYTGVVDMGQGNASTNLQIAGAVLSQESGSMELILPDTENTLPSGSASASRCTYVYGNALIIAAAQLKETILEKSLVALAAETKEELDMGQGKVVHRQTGREISFKTLASSMNPPERIATGFFQVPVTEEARDVIYMGPHCIFSYGAHLACVEIDESTGQVAISAYLAVTDAGRVLNPVLYEQQIQGGIAQGIGYALMEDLKVSEGHIKTEDLAAYKIPTALDIPNIVSIPVEIGEETGPFGIKGIGEISINGPLPAIANAIHDACGIRIPRAPFTAERIFTALDEKKQEG